MIIIKPGEGLRRRVGPKPLLWINVCRVETCRFCCCSDAVSSLSEPLSSTDSLQRDPPRSCWKCVCGGVISGFGNPDGQEDLGRKQTLTNPDNHSPPHKNASVAENLNHIFIVDSNFDKTFVRVTLCTALRAVASSPRHFPSLAVNAQMIAAAAIVSLRDAVF